MRESENEIKQLEKKAILLEPPESEREKIISSVKSYINSYINELENVPSFKKGAVELGKTNFCKPVEIEGIISELQSVFQYGINASSGGHLGYIPGGGLFASSMGDLIAAVTNEYAGMEFGSPGAVAIESQLIDWMKSIFDYPENAVGNLTSGGSVANLIAFTAARDQHEIKNEKIPRSVVYLSEQVHHCVMKAMRIIGLSDVIIRYIPLDSHHRMDVEALQSQIEEDRNDQLKPFIVVASAGTTDTGAVDPLNKIADVAEKNKLWFHVDAAYGGFFILSEKKKHLFEGISRSDSLVIDPHKGLFLPYGLGTVLIKKADAVLESHHYVANYMEGAYEGATIYSPADLSPELTKHFRGLRLWMALKLHGLEPFVANLNEKILLTHYFLSEIEELGFNKGPEPDLSVSYFYFPSMEQLQIPDNEFNKKFHEFMLEDGEIFFSTTNISNKFVIRIAVLSFRTHKRTIDKGINMIKRCLKKTKEHFNN